MSVPVKTVWRWLPATGLWRGVRGGGFGFRETVRQCPGFPRANGRTLRRFLEPIAGAVSIRDNQGTILPVGNSGGAIPIVPSASTHYDQG